MINEKFKQFIFFLHQNFITSVTNICDATNISREIYDKESNIKCELIAYVLGNIVYDALHKK